jgi:glycosyltransferase involved in cell wall biosynthesis
MRIHLPGLPHNDPVRATEYCAFAQRIRRLADALTDLGHHVFIYAGPDCDARGEHVQVASRSDRHEWFGTETFEERVFDRWDPTDLCWLEMNAYTILAIRRRLQPGDIIGITAGRAQQAIADAFPHHVKAEVFAGYEGIMPERTHICFESEAWRHHCYGRCGINDGRWFDAVLPNFFDPADLQFSAEKEPFLLYLGRMTARKGLEVVAELAKEYPVVTAGQGADRVPGATHVGVVRGKEKAELLARARAVLVPTRYIEPFGGVAVEAMMSGTPVITSPFGAFTETVAHGVTGYRCHTRADFLEAADVADDLDPKQIRDWAVERYGAGVVAPQYSRWLDRLATLYDRGWYQ